MRGKRARLLLLAGLIALLLGPTTALHAAAYTYDDAPVARLNASANEAATLASSQSAGSADHAVSPPVEVRDACTTPPCAFIATNTVRPGTDLVKYEAYPPAATSPRGFVGGPVRDTPQPGTAISRYGGEGGTFASPAGTPFSARGLPPGHEALGESRYVFARPLEVDAGIAAYWQGGGGGIQYDLPRSISDLVNDGILKRLP